MGCIRLFCSFKLYVSFAKEPYRRDFILQKRPIIWARGGQAPKLPRAIRVGPNEVWEISGVLIPGGTPR